MDGTMSLFEADFSLFGGDLLFPPPAVSVDETVTQSQDGLKTLPTPDHVEWSENELSQDVLSPEAVSGGLLQDWLDTPVDLLNLFCGDAITLDSSSLGISIDTDNAIKTELPGLEALKSLTDELALELSTEAIAPPVSPTPVEADLSGLKTEDVYDTGLGLIELLTTAVENNSVSEIAGLDLMPMDMSSPILSPMSPEDVETILSSGPTSPVSCATERSFESFLSPDNSLIDFSMMEDESNDFSVMADKSNISEDLVELAQLVQHSDSDDLEHSTSPAASPRSSRPKPYERSKKKSQKESAEPGDFKVVDRKMRKKQQNKDAATRYRQKKKMENDMVSSELTGLETKNTKLKDQVDQMTKEIQYLKNLLVDVQKARIKREKSE